MYLFLLLVPISVISADNSALQDFVNANNLFASSVYKEILKKEDSNFLVSPFSAETILALTLSGCKDETADELRTALHLPDKNRTEAAVKTLLPTVKSNEFFSLHTANKMYLKPKFVVKDDFKRVATEVFSAASENIDFSKTIEAAESINKWVEGQTEKKIKNLINPSVLSPKTAAVLINALYFRSNWSMPFPEFLTRKDSFYKSGNEVVQVDTMYTEDKGAYFNYYESGDLDAKFLELPFEGDEATMTIILPNKKDGLTSLENQIDKIFTRQKLINRLVYVQLPKFKIESEIDFKELLQNLGVTTIFTPFEADLSGISGEKGDLVVSEVVQKTFIDVDEGGVEAAAATYVLIYETDSLSLPPSPVRFIADHPFIFYIRVKGLIIFAGRVVVPNH